jgi:2-methylcitrate dehydratase PrpD
MALRLIRGGNEFKNYSEENIRDPEILRLAKRVEYIVDEELKKLPNETSPAKLTIRFKDDAIYKEQIDNAKGTIQNPMTNEELRDTFRCLASMVLSGVQVEEIIQTVEELERLDHVYRLESLLVAGGSR